MTRNKSKQWAAVCFAGALTPYAILAQSTASPSAGSSDADGIQEIIVTAERRPDAIQKSALAIQAVDSNALREVGTLDSSLGLESVMPSVHVQQLALYSNIFINGVGGGDVNAYGSPAVSYSIDGVFIDSASAPSTALYDVQRVELVKGPQGTLYGRNATAGALNVIPNKPVFSDESSVSVEYGNYNDTQVSGMTNIPLSSTVATRFAFETHRHEGYLSNGTDDDDSQAVRGQVLWNASDALTLQAYADYFHLGGKGVQTVPLYPGANLSSFGLGAIAPGTPPTQKLLNPSNPWQAVAAGVYYPTLIPPPFPQALPLAGPDAGMDQNETMAHLQADWNVGFGTVTVIPAWVRTVDDDLNYIGGFRQHETDGSTETTLEARLASNSNPDRRIPLDWVVGLYGFHTDGFGDLQAFQEGISNVDLSLTSIKDTSRAGFGQLTYSAVDWVRLTAGVRYTSESKSEQGQTVVGNIFLAPPPTPATCMAPFTYYPPSTTDVPDPARCGVPNSGNLHFSSTDYKAAVAIDLSPRNLLYVNYSTGFKAGGFNPGGPPNTYAPERLKDYDIGSKNRFLNNTVQLNATAFYWEYDDQQQQAFGPINPSGYSYIVYPSKSHIYGTSVDAIVLATPVDRIAAQVNYLYGVYDRYQTSSVPGLGIVGINGAGTTRPYSPRFTERLDYTHTFTLPTSATVDLNANANFVGREYIYTTPYVPVANQSSYHKSNANLTYKSADAAWQMGLYVTNIENKYTFSALQPSSTTGNYFGYIDAPRTYGFRVTRNFK
jgi:iron complex outermembrane receptor protein